MTFFRRVLCQRYFLTASFKDIKIQCITKRIVFLYAGRFCTVDDVWFDFWNVRYMMGSFAFVGVRMSLN